MNDNIDEACKSAHEKFCAAHGTECDYWKSDKTSCPFKGTCLKNFSEHAKSLSCSAPHEL